MKNIRNWLILLSTFLILFAVGCSNGMGQATAGSNDLDGSYKKLRGKLIFQGVFPAQEYVKGNTMRHREGAKIAAEMLYGKGKYIEFLNDKELILANQKLNYE